jgi:ABC-type antimicrobial peptide transport system permease subunit
VIPKVIIGVVADAVYRSLRDEMRPTMYVPLAQFDVPIVLSGISISVRSNSGTPVPLARSIARALTAIDRDLSFNFRPLQDQVNASLVQERIVATLSAFFAGLALLLAGLGLYGTTSYAVSRRRTEIGIRMALGAAPAGIVRLVLSRVSMLVGLGALVGAGVSVWAAKFVASLLYGLEPRDPGTLIGAVVLLASVGTLAGWVPAWRASRIDPADVLRQT